jgi:hypothetical protein
MGTCEPATKMEGFCRCFVRLSHEAVARRPNGLRYSRDLVWVHFRFSGDLFLAPPSCYCQLSYPYHHTLLLFQSLIPAISRTNNLLLRSLEGFNTNVSLFHDPSSPSPSSSPLPLPFPRRLSPSPSSSPLASPPPHLLHLSSLNSDHDHLGYRFVRPYYLYVVTWSCNTWYGIGAWHQI